ncbi:MAG: hypothetical protein IIW37_02570 [Bacteroidaceae bacterium]|nr:hypothetical protein [Bacteroidaceae bacterium]
MDSSILNMDGQLDSPLVGMLEQKFEKCRFSRVDGDTIDRLIQKDDNKGEELAADEAERLTGIFNAVLPKLDKVEFHVETRAMGEETAPVVITQSEYMRRMKEMSQLQAGMSFYGEMPDMMGLVLNSDHRLVKGVLTDAASLNEQLQPVEADLRGLNARRQVMEQAQRDKKSEEITQEERDELTKTNNEISEKQNQKKEILAAYAKGNQVVSQLIDIALLQNGLLRGEALSKFLRRSIDMIK